MRGDLIQAMRGITLPAVLARAAELRPRCFHLRVRGAIEHFEPKLFVRKYHVILASPEKFIRVVCTFDYPNELKTVYSTERGQKLVGQSADNKQVTLLQTGQTIVVRGKCKGIDLDCIRRRSSVVTRKCSGVEGVFAPPRLTRKPFGMASELEIEALCNRQALAARAVYRERMATSVPSFGAAAVAFKDAVLAFADEPSARPEIDREGSDLFPFDDR